MKLTGKILDLIPLLIKQCGIEKVYDIEAKEHKSGRSLDANSYYWKLVGEFAKWARKSNAYIHNDMLAHYGLPLEGAEVWLPDAPEAEFRAMEAQAYHLSPTDVCEEIDGIMKRRWHLMKPSHEMTTDEFSRLIDGIIQTIQGCGAPVETMTPAELAAVRGYHGKA